jgi:hypothetical protein
MNTHACGDNTLRVEIPLCIWKSHSGCINHALSVVITLVRVEITVVSVAITFVRVKITQRMATTLGVYKSHCACENHTRAS